MPSKDFAHLEAERCSLPFEGGWQPVGDAVDVVLVYHRFNLEVGKVVDLAYHLSGSDVLSQFHIQQSQFSVYRGTHFQLVLALADEEDVLAHVVQVVFHLVHLDGAVNGVLHGWCGKWSLARGVR